MSIGTYLVIPCGDPKRARRELSEQDIEHIGLDYVVLFRDARFDAVTDDVGRWGAMFAAELPVWLRDRLDKRGLFACPQVGEGLEDLAVRYAEVIEDEPGHWLPMQARKTKSQPAQKRMLIALSPAREKLLLGDADLVRTIVDNRKTQPIPGSLEMGPAWSTLERVLLHRLPGASKSSEPRDALVPAGAILLTEDKTIEAAHLVKAHDARRVAEWITSLPKGGGAKATRDSDAPPAPDVAALATELAGVKAFYAKVLRDGSAVLSIRFRE